MAAATRYRGRETPPARATWNGAGRKSETRKHPP
jgi:hypothetical protein